MTYLAVLQDERGRQRAARDLCEEAFATSRKTLTREHPLRGLCAYNVLRSRLDDAEPMLTEPYDDLMWLQQTSDANLHPNLRWIRDWFAELLKDL